MSRQNERRAHNAASLIRPAMVVKVCADCGAYAIGCYDFELQHVADYCRKHAAEHGYCTTCGNALTDAEKTGLYAPTGECDACLARFEADYREYEWDEPDE